MPTNKILKGLSPEVVALYKEASEKWRSVIPGDAAFVGGKKEGEIAISDFPGQKGKYLSTVFEDKSSDEEDIYVTSKTQIKAAYIREKNQVTEVKIQKFKMKNGVAEESPVEIRIDTHGIEVLVNFLEFLIKADIRSIDAGRLTFEQNIALDPDLEAKLKLLAKDKKGKETLLQLFNNGYLSSDLDIPELIRNGLSKQIVAEKTLKLAEFQKMIEDVNVKEVSDIQNWLKENPWVFGPEYERLDFRGAGDQGLPDGRLLRIDGLSDILEIKLPKAELLREDEKRRQFIAPQLSEAIGQLTGYLEYYYSVTSIEKDDNTQKEILQDTYGKYYKPKGILLIGRRFTKDGTETIGNTINAEPKKLRRLLSYFHWVEVITYDDLIERAHNGLKNLSIDKSDSEGQSQVSK